MKNKLEIEKISLKAWTKEDIDLCHQITRDCLLTLGKSNFGKPRTIKEEFDVALSKPLTKRDKHTIIGYYDGQPYCLVYFNFIEFGNKAFSHFRTQPNFNPPPGLARYILPRAYFEAMRLFQLKSLHGFVEYDNLPMVNLLKKVLRPEYRPEVIPTPRGSLLKTEECFEYELEIEDIRLY